MAKKRSRKKPDPYSELRELAAPAQAGDMVALERARTILRENPSFWEKLNADENTARVQLKTMTGKNELAFSAIEHEADRTRKALEGSAPSAIERLIVRRVLHAWLHVVHVETALASMTDLASKRYEYTAKLVARAERRYLRALETLARIRRLPTPAVQYVDARQVHVNAANE